jgi:nicotinate-nucleotide adenylyltransferase
VTGLLGGAFDPPHNGHVALARAALDHFVLERLRVLVVAAPAHKPVETDSERRLLLARLAFADLPRTEVVLDDHPYTVDSVRDPRLVPADALFLIGADQFASFLTWREPEEILAQVRLGVATRPGYPRDRLEAVRARLGASDRVEFFEIPAVPISSREIRARLADGASIEGLVSEPVAQEIADSGAYRHV